MGVTLIQKIRSCGNNCPPCCQKSKTLMKDKQNLCLSHCPKCDYKKRTFRSFKIHLRSEYKRFLISLKFMKLYQKRKQAFCPL